MANSIRYFIGNWKMFGVPSSYKILDNINQFYQKDTKNKKKYRIIIAPPNTLLQDFSKKFQNKNIIISSQNCYHKDKFGSFTGNVSPFMIKQLGVNYTIIGHSECRSSGETDEIIKKKFELAIKNNLKIIFCIGENKNQKKSKITIKVLKRQISKAISKKSDFKNLIIAYEPIWSIGSGQIPSVIELKKNIEILKNFTKKKFRLKQYPKILYGGSIDKNTIEHFKSNNELDGFLVGGASKSSKNFIDIIKKFYK